MLILHRKIQKYFNKDDDTSNNNSNNNTQNNIYDNNQNDLDSYDNDDVLFNNNYDYTNNFDDISDTLYTSNLNEFYDNAPDQYWKGKNNQNNDSSNDIHIKN